MSGQMVQRSLAEALGRFEPVGLEEVTATADLQTRKDRKYLVAVAELPGLLSAVDAGCRVLTIGNLRQFAYRSTYFDTPGLEIYLDAAQRRPSRFKVRTRHYLDTQVCMLEVKTRDRGGRTVKHRVTCDPTEESGLSTDGRAFVAATRRDRALADELVPSLTTTYHRTTLLLGSENPVRVTIDTALAWQDATGARMSLGAVALIETKTTGRPCSFDRILWGSGHRPTSISKYCTGRAALDPTLPANKWNRLLRRHLDWQPDRTSVRTERRSRALLVAGM